MPLTITPCIISSTLWQLASGPMRRNRKLLKVYSGIIRHWFVRYSSRRRSGFHSRTPVQFTYRNVDSWQRYKRRCSQTHSYRWRESRRQAVGFRETCGSLFFDIAIRYVFVVFALLIFSYKNHRRKNGSERRECQFGNWILLSGGFSYGYPEASTFAFIGSDWKGKGV